MINVPVWINPSKVLGDNPNDEYQGVLARMRAISTGLQRIALDRHIETPASTLIVKLEPISDPNDSAVKSQAFRLPFPVQVGEVQGVATAAGGSAATADVLVGPDTTDVASILDDPIDIKTGLAEPETARPAEDSDVVPAGSVIVANFTGTGAGAVTGAAVWVVCKRV